MKIFIWRNNEELGPLSRDEVFLRLSRGEIGHDDPARTAEKQDWRPLADVLRESAPVISLTEFSPASTVVEENCGTPVGGEGQVGALRGIFIWHNENEHGPFSLNEIKQLLARGEFAESDFMRRESDFEWRTLVDFLNAASMTFDADPASPAGEEKAATIEPDCTEMLWKGSDREAAFHETHRFAVLAKRILVAGVVGMVTAFSAVCFVLMRQEKLASKAEAAEGTARNGVVSDGHTSPVNNGALTKNSNFATNATNTAGKKLQDQITLSDSPKPGNIVGLTADHVIPNQLAANTSASGNHVSGTQAVPATSGTLDHQPKAVASSSASPHPHSHHPHSWLVNSHGKAVPGPADGDKLEVWVADTAKKPRAILAVWANGNPKLIARDPVWQKFAIDNGLALTVVTFSSKNHALVKKGGDFLQVQNGSGQLLLDTLDQTFGQSLPIILYGQWNGGTYTMNFARWQKHRLLAWAAYYNDNLPAATSTSGSTSAIQTSKLPPKAIESDSTPGIIACDDNAPLSVLRKGQHLFAAGRLQNEPLTLLRLTGTFSDRAAQLDNFVREYMAGVLARNAGNIANGDIWVDNKNKQRLSALDLLKDKPYLASWVPDLQTYNQWKILTGAPAAEGLPTVIEQDVATKNPAQPILQLYLRLPPGVSNGGEVSGVLAYCTWEDNKAVILNKLHSSAEDVAQTSNTARLMEPYLAFAEQHNMAVLTWGTVNAWDNSLSTEELDRKEQEEFNHNFDLLANAWARGVAELGQKTGIPQNDFLLYGISRGGQWAHRLALRKPQYFLAVHVHIPSTFDVPTSAGSKALWLVTTGEREAGYERAQRFYHECVALGYPIMFKAIMDLGHADSPIEHELGFKFFEYALSLKAERDTWLQKAEDPFRKELNQSPPPAQWLEAFRAPPYYGDFLNQDCFPADQSDMIPAALRVPLPTKELADLWNR